ncbi:MAG: GNAT family N-acetyltransferase [Rhizobiaceae bacterium]|nr:GNAT family N-acetyltransferase [Rhizobiaceae bacterium]
MIGDDFCLYSKHFQLRKPSIEDIPHIFTATRVKGFNDGMAWDPPESMSDLEEPLLRNLQGWKNGTNYTFTIEEKTTETFLGRISIRHEEGQVYDIGFWTHPEHQRKGIMTEVVAEVINFGFDNLDAETIYAGHAVWNIASKKVLEKNGFAFVDIQKNGFE